MSSVENNIPEGWIETTLGELVKIKYGKDHKKLEDGNIPCMGSGGLMRTVEKALYNRTSILIPRKGTLSNLFYIDKPFWTVDTLFYTEIDENRITPRCLFYKLSTINLADLNVGSAVPSLTTAVLKQLQLIIPKNITEQKAIAKVLTAFDDKIENLRAQNQTLEQTAQTIFKEWFGQHQIDDELPDGWRVGKLGEEFEIVMGQSPKGSSYNELGIGTLFFQGRAEFTERFPKKRLYTTEPKRMAETKDVLVSVRAPVGDVNIAKENCCIGRGLSAVKSLYKSYALYKIQSLKPQFDLFESEGTVFGSINKKSFSNIEVVIPQKSKIIEFEKIGVNIDEKIFQNSTHIQTLTQTRDTLLPKLMRGKLRLNGFKN